MVAVFGPTFDVARAQPSATADAAGRVGMRFAAEQRVLRVSPVPAKVAADAPDATPAQPQVQLCDVSLEAGERIALAELQRPGGWTIGASSRGRAGCLLQMSAPAPAIEIPVAGDRVAVTFERSAQGGAAIVELAGQTRLVELAGDGPLEVQLGRGVPHHAWRAPRSAPYERSLAHDAGFVGSAQAPFARRFALDRWHALDPHPALPAAAASLPIEITYPEVFLPAGAEVALGLVRAQPATQPLQLRIDARFEPLLALPASGSSTTVVLAEDALQRVDVPLRTSLEGRGRLTLSMTAVGAAAGGANVEIVDPLVRGMASAHPERPNVIWITLDTVRADHLSAYGYRRATTPFLEKLAGESRFFASAYAQVTNTRPSHFSMFTGRYCSDLGIWNNDGPALPQRELTLAEVLRSAGWATGAVVSVDFLGVGSGLDQGFDEVDMPPRGTAQLGEETTRKALGFVRAHAGEPFHLWVHYFDAHLPYQPVPALRHLFWQGPPPTEETVDRTLILPEFIDGLFALPNVEYMTAMYDASLRYLDDQLRVLFDHLRAADLLDETIVVVAADHGESLGEHGIYFAHAGLYETTVHVPLLIHVPAALARPARVPDVVENLDIAATILSLVGLRQPDSFRGDSLLRERPGDGSAFFEHYGGFSTGMRRGSLKIIDSRELKNHRERVGPSLRLWYESPALQLFDVAADPGETNDLAAGQPDLLRENLAVLDAWRADHAVRPPLTGARDPKLGESLRALGYVE